MADKLESALSTGTDAAYVRAIDANGNSIQISKEDLASVISSVMNTNKLFPFMEIGTIDDDVNNTTRSGIYNISPGAANRPPFSEFVEGQLVLVSFNTDGLIIQICARTLYNSLSIRSYNNTEWCDWKLISMT